MLNKMQIIGRVGQNPMPTERDGAITSVYFSVGCNEKWKDKQTNTTKEHTEWFSVKVFGPLCDVAINYVKQGGLIYVEGKMRTNEWFDNKTGEKRKKQDLIASSIVLLGHPREKGENSPQANSVSQDGNKLGEGVSNDFENDEIPF